MNPPTSPFAGKTALELHYIHWIPSHASLHLRPDRHSHSHLFSPLLSLCQGDGSSQSRRCEASLFGGRAGRGRPNNPPETAVVPAFAFEGVVASTGRHPHRRDTKGDKHGTETEQTRNIILDFSSPYVVRRGHTSHVSCRVMQYCFSILARVFQRCAAENDNGLAS